MAAEWQTARAGPLLLPIRRCRRSGKMAGSTPGNDLKHTMLLRYLLEMVVIEVPHSEGSPFVMDRVNFDHEMFVPVANEQLAGSQQVSLAYGPTDRIDNKRSRVRVQPAEGKLRVAESLGQTDRVTPTIRDASPLDVLNGPSESMNPSVDAEKKLVVARALAYVAHDPSMTCGCDNFGSGT